MTTIRDFSERLSALTRQGLDSVSAELRANARARLGLAALFCVVAIAGALRLWNFGADKAAELAELSEREAQIRDVAEFGDAAWIRAKADAEAELRTAAQRLWSRDPPGVAHADFYTWVAEACTAAGLNGAQVRIGDLKSVGDDEALREMRVIVSTSSALGGAVSSDSIQRLVRHVAAEPRLVVARSLKVRFTPNTTFDAEFAAFVAPPPPPRERLATAVADPRPDASP